MAFEIFKGIPITKFFVDEFLRIEALKSLSGANKELATSMLFVSYMLEKGCLVGLLQELFQNPTILADRYEYDSVMFCDDLLGVLTLLLQFQFKLGLNVEDIASKSSAQFKLPSKSQDGLSEVIKKM